MRSEISLLAKFSGCCCCCCWWMLLVFSLFVFRVQLFVCWLWCQLNTHTEGKEWEDAQGQLDYKWACGLCAPPLPPQKVGVRGAQAHWGLKPGARLNTSPHCRGSPEGPHPLWFCHAGSGDSKGCTNEAGEGEEKEQGHVTSPISPWISGSNSFRAGSV